MIEIKNFCKDYSSFPHKKSDFSVKDISMKIVPQKVTALLGPNGSGKSTIMKAVCGFHYPTSGTILLSDNDGRTVDVSEKPELAANLVGYVPEQSVLPPEMKVLDFLRYTGEIHGLSGKMLQQAVENVIEKCSLEEVGQEAKEAVLEKKIKKLSKGYRQRVSFAQAIIHNPPNLILDEAVTGLDPAQIIQMRNLIKDLSKNTSILLSTHILQEVDSLCDEIFIIKKGKICISGTEEEIKAAEKTETLEQAFFKIITDEAGRKNEK